MNLLLDTHALLWWWLDDAQLSQNARKHIEDEHNEVFVSAASAWEITTKHRLGKLGLPDIVFARYQSLLAADGFKQLSIKTEHALLAGAYPQPHGDPFDRMLAAQAEINALTLVGCDAAMHQFGVELLW